MIVSGITRLFRHHFPLFFVIGIALIVAYQNINPATIYSGWDNIHAEFDLARYARQVFFGAWIEHQGLGAPAAQGHLAEVPRLPLLFILHTLLPAHLVRYAFIFLMYLIGGVGMYWYLVAGWLKNNRSTLQTWLAGLGATFYLLHILTLQQFYISFEMFLVQFAFLPLLLLTIHRLAKGVTAKSLLIFIFIQLLLAPSAHTPTVFYLAGMFAVLYAFFLNLKKGVVSTTRFSFLVGLLIFLANAYWLLPNAYYTVRHSAYVAESRTNQLFAPESIWSVREAGTLANLTSGTHYLFSWRDYSFADQQFTFIFDEWLPHLNRLPIKLTLQLFGLLTLVGAGLIFTARKKGHLRWAILLTYLFCLVFIWVDLLPTNVFINQLYKSASFREAFRNPFTKLSILYSFVSILLFIQTSEVLLKRLNPSKVFIFPGKLLARLSLLLIVTGMVAVAWPSFQGHFISEKLQIQYPTEYQSLFAYLQQQDSQQRILQLPQFSHASWEYYDWSFLEPGNGYQGMGFYFFGFPQPFLTRDADRWVETSDFFYHELKYALDVQDAALFQKVLEKYRVDLIIVDETRLDPNRPRDYDQDHQLVLAAGLEEVWSEGFLTLYQRQTDDADQVVFTPQTLALAAGNTDRVRADVAFHHQGDYLVTSPAQATVFYPFADVLAHRLTEVVFTKEGISLARQLPAKDYTLHLSGINRSTYFVPVSLAYQDQTVTAVFPEITITTQEETVALPKLTDFEFSVASNLDSIIVFFNDVGVIVEQGQTVSPVLKLDVGDSVQVDYAITPAEIRYLPSGDVDDSQLVINAAHTFTPAWSELEKELTFTTGGGEIKVASHFPIFTADLLQNPAVNCSLDQRGSIDTQLKQQTVLYQADDFGVNCGGYVFEHLSATYPYVMKLVGQNLQGRGTKFFVSFTDQAIVPEDYLIQEDEFEAYITLGPVSTNPRSIFYLNWETRSFGKEDVNQLASIELAHFPLDRLAGLSATIAGEPIKLENTARVISTKTYLDSIHLIKADCQQAPCFIGLDQSDDDLWLAFKLWPPRLLTDHRYNNWAKMWQFSQSGIVVIFYLPELISLVSMAGLAGWILVLIGRSWRR